MEQTTQPVQAQDQKLTTPMDQFQDIMNDGFRMFNGFESEVNVMVRELY